MATIPLDDFAEKTRHHLTLKKRDYVQSIALDPHVLQSLHNNSEFGTYVANYGLKLVAAMHYTVYSCDRNFKVVVELPASPWQWLRRALLPKWWLKRFPVQMRQVLATVQVSALFPEVPVKDRYYLVGLDTDTSTAEKRLVIGL